MHELSYSEPFLPRRFTTFNSWAFFHVFSVNIGCGTSETEMIVQTNGTIVYCSICKHQMFIDRTVYIGVISLNYHFGFGRTAAETVEGIKELLKFFNPRDRETMEQAQTRVFPSVPVIRGRRYMYRINQKLLRDLATLQILKR